MVSAFFLILASSLLPGLASSIVSPHSVAAAQPRTPTQASTPGNVTVSVNPHAIIGPASQVTFGVNMSLVGNMTSFYVTLQYDNTVLNALSIDYSGGIFGQLNPAPIYDCVNSQPAPGTLCPQAPYNGPDEVSLQLLLFTQTVYNQSGLLFNVNFQVKGTGLANIHIVQALIASGPILIPPSSVVTVDGYFSNKLCPPGSTVFCRPLKVNFNYTALPSPVVGRIIRFNATVVNPNNDPITLYQWIWGESCTNCIALDNTTRPFATHTFQNPGTFSVTLIVYDNYGVTGLRTIKITVGRVWVDPGIGSLTANPANQVVPGTSVNVTVQVQNLGTANQTAQVTLLLDLGKRGNQTLLVQTCPSMRPNSSCSSSKILDTSGFTPRVYRVIANVQLPFSNSTFHDNDTSNDSQWAFVQIVQPLPANLSLSLLQGSGLGIGILVVAYAAYSILRRVSGRKPEL